VDGDGVADGWSVVVVAIVCGGRVAVDVDVDVEVGSAFVSSFFALQ